VIDARAEVATVSRLTWYCVTELKFTAWLEDIVMGDVVTVPAVATILFEPPSTFHDATLCPVPAALLYRPLDKTVVELALSYQPSDVGEGVPYAIPLPPVTVRKY